jgi:isoamylase
LLDPYAKAIGRPLIWADELFGYQLGDPDGDLSFDDRDSAPFAPLGAVIDTRFDWSGEKRPSFAAHETIIYEAHIRGMTMTHPDVPAAFARHVRRHGIAADHRTSAQTRNHHVGAHAGSLLRAGSASAREGLKNYWGYNSLGFFAPDLSYASQPRHAHRGGARVQADGEGSA